MTPLVIGDVEGGSVGYDASPAAKADVIANLELQKEAIDVLSNYVNVRYMSGEITEVTARFFNKTLASIREPIDANITCINLLTDPD